MKHLKYSVLKFVQPVILIGYLYNTIIVFAAAFGVKGVLKVKVQQQQSGVQQQLLHFLRPCHRAVVTLSLAPTGNSALTIHSQIQISLPQARYMCIRLDGYSKLLMDLKVSINGSP